MTEHMPDVCLHIRFGKFAVSRARREVLQLGNPTTPPKQARSLPAFPPASNYVVNAGFQSKAEALHPRWLAPSREKCSQVKAVALELLLQVIPSPAGSPTSHSRHGCTPCPNWPPSTCCIPYVPFAGCKGLHAIYPQHYQTRARQ